MHPGTSWAWLREGIEGLGCTLSVYLEAVGVRVWEAGSITYPSHHPFNEAEPMAEGVVCMQSTQTLYYEMGDGVAPPAPHSEGRPVWIPSNTAPGLREDDYHLTRTTLCNNGTHHWRLLVWRHVCDALSGGPPTWATTEMIDSLWLGHHGAAIVVEFVQRNLTHGAEAPWPLPHPVSLRLLNRLGGPAPLGFDAFTYPLAPAG